MRFSDTIDNRILREIGSPRTVQWNVRESYASIAKRVGVDEETVRKRIKRMEGIGLIMGWRVMVNPSLIGCSYAFIDLEVQNTASKPDILSQLKLVEGVVALMNFEGGGITIFLYAEAGDALTRKAQLIGLMCGTEKPTVELIGIPPYTLLVTATDWRIIWAIRNEPRKNLTDIARETKMSTRTVNRRLSLLTERGAFFLIGLPNLKRASGVSANFLIFCAEPGAGASVAGRIAEEFDNIVFGSPLTARHLSYNMVFNNLIEIDEALELIKRIEGVQKVRLGIMREMIFVPDWLDGQIRKHLDVAP